MDLWLTILLEPVSTGTAIKVIVTALASLFGLFGRGVSKAVKRALDTMRESIRQIADATTRFAAEIARGARRLFELTIGVWVDILRNLIGRLKTLLERLTKWLDRILRNHWEAIERIRRRILAIYDRFFRPILEVIQTFRKVLAVLRLARLGFAERLDKRLARLEGRIIAPILLALERLNQHSYFLNVLLTARGLLQLPALVVSIIAYQGRILRALWNATAGPPGTDRPEIIRAANRPLAPEEAARALEDWLGKRSGPFARSIEAGEKAYGEISGSTAG